MGITGGPRRSSACIDRTSRWCVPHRGAMRPLTFTAFNFADEHHRAGSAISHSSRPQGGEGRLMPKMPSRAELRREFDAAVSDLSEMRPHQNLTIGFAARIGDSVFDAGYRAIEDGAAAVESPRSSPRIHVVSAPVGSGKTSYTIALITALVRLGQNNGDAPYGCVWVVEQIHTAEDMYLTLNTLLPGKVAVWSSDHDKLRKAPTANTKVHKPAASSPRTNWRTIRWPSSPTGCTATSTATRLAKSGTKVASSLARSR